MEPDSLSQSLSDTLSLEYSALGFNANTNASELFGDYNSETGSGKECIAFSDATGSTCAWRDHVKDIYLVRLVRSSGEEDQPIAIFGGQRDSMTDITMRFVSTEGEAVLRELDFERVPAGDPEGAQRLLCPDPASPLPTRDEFNRIKCVAPSSIASSANHVPCIIFNDSMRRKCGLEDSEYLDLHFHRNVNGEITTCTLSSNMLTCSPSVRDLTEPITSTSDICDPDYVPVLRSDGDVVCRKRGCIDLQNCK